MLLTDQSHILILIMDSSRKGRCMSPFKKLSRLRVKCNVIDIFTLFQYLTGLRLKYNSLSSMDFIKLCPLISTFTNITSLDLSCNTINIFQNDTACDEMSKLFRELKNLVRLDLSNNRVKSKVRRVLSVIEKPLQYLKLAACGLALTDMTYLSMSHHTRGLQELDISENGLGLSFGTVLHLLQNIRTKVLVLELEDTSLSDNHMDSLNNALKSLPSLLYLNISGNSVLSEKLYELGFAVAGLKHLQFVRLSYPRDVYLPDLGEEQERLKGEFGTKFGHIIYTERERLGITNKVPTVVLSDLDQEMDQL